MITNIWRYSHFALAGSSALFVLLATVTGLILAFEPIEQKVQSFRSKEFKNLTLAPVIDSLKAQYDEVIEFEVDANQFVKASVISMEETLNGDFYIDPSTGRKIADIPEKRPLYEFTTNLHRSLFLKTPGRIFVGITACCLLLIALTGFLLFLKRQKGIRHVFDSIVKEASANYWHVVTGRMMLIPVIVIAFTGVYLSLLRFAWIPEAEPVLQANKTEIAATPVKSLSEFPIFRQTHLSEVRKLEFPFSSDVEDFFILDLTDRQLKINQKTGDVVEERYYPLIGRISTLNFNLHTGTGSILWSLVLALASVNILFFLYSGAIIAYQRLNSKVKNRYGPKEAELILLVGTENGTTRSFGKLLQKALLAAKQKVFLDDLNKYQLYPNARHLVVLTSTYGVGDPPANANRFLDLFGQQPPQQPLQFAVVGFGSLAYPDFCQYALDVDQAIQKQANCQALGKPYLIHNKSYTSFKTWAEQWGKQLDLKLELPAQLEKKVAKYHTFKVLSKQVVKDGFSETFLLTLAAPTSKFQSGDLLAIAPPEDPVERLYSIAKIQNDQILLSIKIHSLGVCSNYLAQLELGDVLEGGIQQNNSFHMPKKAKGIHLIGNGTGMAPFLGMIQASNHPNLALFWGGRNLQSYTIYQPWIEQALKGRTLHRFEMALSKADHPYHYVQDIVREEGQQIAESLKAGGTVMICGSIAMQNGVLEVLEQACRTHLGQRLNKFQQKGQILMDCY